jgi:hypothetical protein
MTWNRAQNLNIADPDPAKLVSTMHIVLLILLYVYQTMSYMTFRNNSRVRELPVSLRKLHNV